MKRKGVARKKRRIITVRTRSESTQNTGRSRLLLGVSAGRTALHARRPASPGGGGTSNQDGQKTADAHLLEILPKAHADGASDQKGGGVADKGE